MVGRGHRQLEREHAPRSWIALRPDPSSVRLDDRPRDRETDSRAAVVPRARGVDAVEALEQPGKMLLRDTRAVVPHGDGARAVAARGRDDDLPSVGREANRV